MKKNYAIVFYYSLHLAFLLRQVKSVLVIIRTVFVQILTLIVMVIHIFALMIAKVILIA